MKGAAAMVALAGTVLVASPLAAQGGARGSARVLGEVFDSLFTRAPLADATVLVEGLDRVITTDARGRFAVDSVPPGRYQATFFHPSLDRAGVQAPVSTFSVADGDVASVRLFTPGVAAVARAACGTAEATRVTFGTVQRVGDRTPVAGALVRATWVELATGTNGLRPTRRGVETRANAAGGFVLCGLPEDSEARVLADGGDGSIGVATHWPSPGAAGTVTVWAPPGEGDARRGRSVVVGADGQPLGDATVAAGRDTTARTDASGAFAIRWAGHPATDLTVRAVGMQPVTLPGDEFGAPPRAMAIAMDQAGRRLAGVTVTASGRRAMWMDEFERRRQAGLGSFITRADIERRNPSQAYQMLFGVPGLQVNTRDGRPRTLYPGTAGTCEPRTFVDGALFADPPGNPRPPGPLALIPPTEIEAIEVYPRASGVPAEFGGSTGGACGVIAIWTRKGGR